MTKTQKIRDRIGWKAEWRIDKFKDPKGKNGISKALQAGMPMTEALRRFKEFFISTEKWERNVGLEEGLYLLCGIISGIDVASNKWDNTNGKLGVGDSNTAPSDDQTGLQAATNKLYKAIDGSYPVRAASESAEDQFVEWRATFPDGDAEWAWEEYSISNDTGDSGKNLNRCIASKGTKATGESWTLSLKITFA